MKLGSYTLWCDQHVRRLCLFLDYQHYHHLGFLYKRKRPIVRSYILFRFHPAYVKLEKYTYPSSPLLIFQAYCKCQTSVSDTQKTQSMNIAAVWQPYYFLIIRKSNVGAQRLYLAQAPLSPKRHIKQSPVHCTSSCTSFLYYSQVPNNRPPPLINF